MVKDVIDVTSII